jgi:hypothetical protein
MNTTNNNINNTKNSMNPLNHQNFAAKILKIGNQSYTICDVKKFCVDPEITSFDVLKKMVAQAFAIRE